MDTRSSKKQRGLLEGLLWPPPSGGQAHRPIWRFRPWRACQPPHFPCCESIDSRLSALVSTSRTAWCGALGSGQWRAAAVWWDRARRLMGWLRAAGGGSGGATLRFWRVLTGRPSLAGPAFVLMFDPAPTYRRRRVLTAFRAVVLSFVLGSWARGRVRPVGACLGTRLRTSAPTSGTPGAEVGPCVWPRESRKRRASGTV